MARSVLHWTVHSYNILINNVVTLRTLHTVGGGVLWKVLVLPTDATVYSWNATQHSESSLSSRSADSSSTWVSWGGGGHTTAPLNGSEGGGSIGYNLQTCAKER